MFTYLTQVLPDDAYKCVLYFSGLLIYPEGPLNPDMDPMNMSEMFRPFQTLLYKIRYESEVISKILLLSSTIPFICQERARRICFAAQFLHNAMQKGKTSIHLSVC